MNHAIQNIIKNVANFTQPHLGRILFNKAPTKHWKERGPEIPLIHPFSPKYIDNNSNTAVNSSSFTSSSLLNNQRKEYGIETDSRRPYRILCLDGGGVRGVLTTALLVRLQRHNPKFLDSIDLIVGTSAGGILSLLLASGYSAQECDEIYNFAAPHIFAFNPWRVMNPFRSKYSDKQKQEIFEYYWGDRNMTDLKKHAAVISFRLDGHKSKTHSFFNKEGWRPAVFSNLPKAGSSILPDSELKVWDAAMRTSAAPTFFPVFKGYTDGGIIANNPSIVAVSKAMAHYSFLSSNNISVLSLGAGYFPRHTNVFSAGRSNRGNGSGSNKSGHTVMTEADYSTGESAQLMRADWGIKQWVPFLLDLLLDGDTITTEMVMQYLLGNNKLYHRLDPSLPMQVALDDLSSIDMLKQYAQTVDISDTLTFIENNFTDTILSGDKNERSNDANNALDNSAPYHTAWEQALKVQAQQQSDAEIALRKTSMVPSMDQLQNQQSEFHYYRNRRSGTTAEVNSTISDNNDTKIEKTKIFDANTMSVSDASMAVSTRTTGTDGEGVIKIDFSKQKEEEQKRKKEDEEIEDDDKQSRVSWASGVITSNSTSSCNSNNTNSGTIAVETATSSKTALVTDIADIIVASRSVSAVKAIVNE